MAAYARAESDGVRKRQARVERGIAVLEHHLHRALHFAYGNAVVASDLLAIEDQGTGVGLDQADQEPRRGRLAAPGLPHNAERLAFAELEAECIDGLHHRAPAAPATREGEMLG